MLLDARYAVVTLPSSCCRNGSVAVAVEVQLPQHPPCSGGRHARWPVAIPCAPCPTVHRLWRFDGARFRSYAAMH